MNKRAMIGFSDRLQRERRDLVDAVKDNDAQFERIATSIESEIEEHAQEERDTRILERIDDRQQSRLKDIDDALARIEAGDYGKCQNCGQPIDEARLNLNLTTTLCVECSLESERINTAPDAAAGATRDIPDQAALPPDLDGLDDEEITEHLFAVLREDGQVDLEELSLTARRGVVYLDGAVPSEGERQQLLNILTDVAGLQDIVDRLEVQPLAWQRDKRSKAESTQGVMPGTIPDQDPGSTEDVVLSNEEGVNYEPPFNPPQPPYKND